MVLDKVANELRAALEGMKAEHAKLTDQISQVEAILAQLGAPAKRRPGRPKGSKTKKRGPRRPKGSGKKAAAAPKKKRGPGRPKGSGKKAAAKKKVEKKPAKARAKPKWSPEAREAARTRMKAYWASRKKKDTGK